MESATPEKGSQEERLSALARDLEEAGWPHGLHHEACLADGTNVLGFAFDHGLGGVELLIHLLPDSALNPPFGRSAFYMACVNRPDLLPLVFRRMPWAVWKKTRHVDLALASLLFRANEEGAPVAPLLLSHGLAPEEHLADAGVARPVTPLHLAAIHSPRDLAFFLDNGAPVTGRGANGQTLLMALARHHSMTDAEATGWASRLLAGGLGLDDIDDHGFPALPFALDAPVWTRVLLGLGARTDLMVSLPNGFFSVRDMVFQYGSLEVQAVFERHEIASQVPAAPPRSPLTRL